MHVLREAKRNESSAGIVAEHVERLFLDDSDYAQLALTRHNSKSPARRRRLNRIRFFWIAQPLPCGIAQRDFTSNQARGLVGKLGSDSGAKNDFVCISRGKELALHAFKGFDIARGWRQPAYGGNASMIAGAQFAGKTQVGIDLDHVGSVRQLGPH